jgi:hypothetical protein
MHCLVSLCRISEGYKSVLNRLEMASNEMSGVLYVVDILYYTITEVDWELGGLFANTVNSN